MPRITISEDAYMALKAEKKEEESFSSSNPLAAIFVMKEYLSSSGYILPISRINDLTDLAKNTDNGKLDSDVEKFLYKNIREFT